MTHGPWLLICGVKSSEWVYHIRAGKQLVGRDTECGVRLNHRSVSRRHAEIVFGKKQLIVRDLQSTNRTFVNDEHVVVSRFVAGDTLRFGSVTLDVLASLEGLRLATDDADEETEPRPEDRGAGIEGVFELLSPTDRKVLRLLLDGLPEKQVAGELELTEQTVHWRVKRVYRALGVHSRAQLSALFRGTTKGKGKGK